MKGILFNLFEEMVDARYGEQAWDSLLAVAGLEGGYSSLGTYADAELARLVGACASMTGRSDAEMLRALGQHSLKGLSERYPGFFAPHERTLDFLLTLNDVIHAEVRKLHAESDPPEFHFEVLGPDVLTIHYTSARRMCAFAEGMINGAAAQFGEAVEVAQAACMLTGASSCELVCRFSRTDHVRLPGT